MSRTPNDDRSDSMNPNSSAYNPGSHGCGDDDDYGDYGSHASPSVPRSTGWAEPFYKEDDFVFDIVCLCGTVVHGRFRTKVQIGSRASTYRSPQTPEQIASSFVSSQLQLLERKRLWIYVRIRGAGGFDSSQCRYRAFMPELQWRRLDRTISYRHQAEAALAKAKKIVGAAQRFLASLESAPPQGCRRRTWQRMLAAWHTRFADPKQVTSFDIAALRLWLSELGIHEHPVLPAAALEELLRTADVLIRASRHRTCKLVDEDAYRRRAKYDTYEVYMAGHRGKVESLRAWYSKAKPTMEAIQAWPAVDAHKHTATLGLHPAGYTRPPVRVVFEPDILRQDFGTRSA